MRVDPQMDAQLAELQAALNVDMSAVIRMAVAMMYRQAQENRWLSPLPETPAAAE
jgi:post-segregation antitoxin (ccd killing protein)